MCACFYFNRLKYKVRDQRDGRFRALSMEGYFLLLSEDKLPLPAALVVYNSLKCEEAAVLQAFKANHEIQARLKVC